MATPIASIASPHRIADVSAKLLMLNFMMRKSFLTPWQVQHSSVVSKAAGCAAHEPLPLETDVITTVLLPTLFIVFRTKRNFFAVADRLNSVRAHALRN